MGELYTGDRFPSLIRKLKGSYFILLHKDQVQFRYGKQFIFINVEDLDDLLIDFIQNFKVEGNFAYHNLYDLGLIRKSIKQINTDNKIIKLLTSKPIKKLTHKKERVYLDFYQTIIDINVYELEEITLLLTANNTSFTFFNLEMIGKFLRKIK